MRKREILNANDIERALNRITHEILEYNQGTKDLVLVGIRTRGVFLCERIKKKILVLEKTDVPSGIIDITFYRDDLKIKNTHPELKTTEILFPIDDKKVVIVDDVFFTGRTIRAAMEGLFEIGRPSTIQLAVLVDRGHHELPIKPDYAGKIVPTAKDEIIKVLLKEKDNEERVFVQDARYKRKEDK